MRIRMAKPEDLEQWVAMRTLLWPESEAEHRDGLETYFSGCSIDIEQVFVIDLETTLDLAGFIEVNIRIFAEAVEQPAYLMWKAGSSGQSFVARAMGAP